MIRPNIYLKSKVKSQCVQSESNPSPCRMGDSMYEGRKIDRGRESK